VDAELGAHLLLLVGREGVHDAVHRAGGAGRVQGREDQVARLGGGDGRLHGGQVAHLAHQDHVRVHAQRGAQGRC
jgi:hypothetical protein